MLQAVTEADLETMLSWAQSPMELFQWSGGSLKYPLSVEQLRSYALDDAPNHRALKYVDKSGEMLGYLEFNNIDHKNDSCSFSRVIVAPDERSSGVGKRMVSAAVREVFENLGLNRISLHVFDFNPGAIRCYEQAGFVREGLLRQVYKHDDRYWNVYLMSVLRAEFDIR